MNKKKLQIGFFAILVIGLALTLFKDTRPFGYVLLCIFQPFIALYYINQVKKTETIEAVELGLRYPLLISLQFTFIVLLIKMFFMTMHWPFAGPVNMVIYVSSIISLLFGIAFIIKNRKIISSVFVFEFIILIMPVFLLLCFVMPANFNGLEYSHLFKKQYEDLNQIESTLYQNVKNDTLIDLTMIDIIDDIKRNTIVQYGGLKEDGTLQGGRTRIDLKYAEKDLEKLHSDSLTRSIMRQSPSSVIEHVSNLTKLQIDLLLKDKNR